MSQKRSGQSLVEILIAVAVGTIMLLGAITAFAPAIKSQTDANRSQIGAALGKELLDSVRVFSESDWHNIDNLAVTSASKYLLNNSTSSFASATGTESVLSGVTNSGLVGYWKFDDASGTQLMDFSGAGNNGIWHGTSTTRYVPGRAGYAGQFNGTGDYVDVGTSTIVGTGPFTLAAWIDTTSLANYSGAISIGNSVTAQAAYIGVVAAAQVGVSNSIGGGFYGANFGSGDFSLNNWVHIAMTFAGDTNGTTTIYINGANRLSTTYTPSLGSATRRIGRIGTDITYDFSGNIDDARIYNRALSAAEIQAIYSAQTFFRDFYVDDVYRDNVTGNIVSVGGSIDPSTKKVTVEYYWTPTAVKTLSMYLTRFINRSLVQTDWSKGNGIDGPVSTSSLGFSTSTGVATSTPGEIKIIGF